MNVSLPGRYRRLAVYWNRITEDFPPIYVELIDEEGETHMPKRLPRAVELDLKVEESKVRWYEGKYALSEHGRYEASPYLKHIEVESKEPFRCIEREGEVLVCSSEISEMWP